MDSAVGRFFFSPMQISFVIIKSVILIFLLLRAPIVRIALFVLIPFSSFFLYQRIAKLQCLCFPAYFAPIATPESNRTREQQGNRNMRNKNSPLLLFYNV